MRKTDLDELVDALAGYTNDPFGFVCFAFPWGEGELKEYEGPDEWQKELLCDVRDGIKSVNEVVQYAIASGHGIGKSALVAWLILWAISTHEDTKGVVTANTDTQLRTKTWAELAKWHRLFIAKDMFVYTATSIFANDKGHERTWRIDMVPWSERNTEAFAGLHNKGKRILVIFDEASAIPNVVWEVSEGALTDKDTEILWFAFGNPTRNTGRFYDCFHKFRHRWQYKQIDSRTVRMTNKEQIEKWVADYGEESDFVKVRVRGLFPSASDCQFIGADIVSRAQKIKLRKEQIQSAPVIIGVDPSWTGSDEFVIYMRQGLHSKMLASYERNDDDMRMAGIIARFADEYDAVAVNIDAGFGTGIYSAGKLMGRDWALINFASKPGKEYYQNKRVEMWAEMRQWLLDGGAIDPDDGTLYNDLIAPEAFINTRGKLQLESKDDMKKRGQPSPNRADALALTFARNILPKQVLDRLDRQQGEIRRYSPFSRM